MPDLFSSPPDTAIAISGGGRFDVFHPVAGSITLEDLALALSRQARFLGRTPVALSVAQHSIEVARWSPPGLAAWGLLHDAAEAFLGDWPRPIRQQVYFRDPTDGDAIGGELISFDELEARVLRAVAERFDLPGDSIPLEVQQVDDRVLATEIRGLWDEDPTSWGVEARPYPTTSTIAPLAEHYARKLFLEKARDLGVE